MKKPALYAERRLEHACSPRIQGEKVTTVFNKAFNLLVQGFMTGKLMLLINQACTLKSLSNPMLHCLVHGRHAPLTF